MGHKKTRVFLPYRLSPEECDDCASEELQSLRALYQGKRDVYVQSMDAFMRLTNLHFFHFSRAYEQASSCARTHGWGKTRQIPPASRRPATTGGQEKRDKGGEASDRGPGGITEETVVLRRTCPLIAGCTQ